MFTMKNPLPKGTRPSDAVEAIFASNAGTELDCNTMMVAVSYRAILHAMGEDNFNDRFTGSSEIVLSKHNKPPSAYPDHPIHTLYKQVKLNGFDELLPGDWVYFKNKDDYLDHHPTEDWQGEHAIYLGNGLLEGFGTQILTNDEMLEELAKHYNDGLAADEQITSAEVPGLLHYVRRPDTSQIIK